VRDALHECIGAGTQKNHQVWLGNLFGQGLVYAMVHRQFVAGQVDAGKERVFFEGIVGNNGSPGSERIRYDPMLLLIAA